MSEKSLRNGEIMAFGFWKRLCRARPVLWPWNGCKKIARWSQTGLYWVTAGRQNGNPGLERSVPNKRGSEARSILYVRLDQEYL